MGHMLIPLIGMGLTMGGSALNGINEQQFRDAQISAERDATLRSRASRERELARQAEFQKTASDYQSATMEGTGADSNAVARANAEQRFLDLYDQRGTTQPEGQYLSGQESSNDVIKDEIARRASTSAADARARVVALAKVGSFEEAMQKSGLLLQSNADKLNTIGGMRRGSLDVAGQEGMIAPAQTIRGNNLLGPLMQAAGGITSSFGGTPGGFGSTTTDWGGNQHTNWDIGSLFGGLGASAPASKKLGLWGV
jgi:hypothetical protein